jgi:uncharacterized protein YdiU (UPF0061 family)
MAEYRPDPKILTLGEGFFDAVQPAAFPLAVPRFLNRRAARSVGLDLDEAGWERHFHRFEPLPGNLEGPLALRYHGHQFRNYNPDIGDGRGFLFAQLRDERGRLLDLATKGSGQTPYSRFGDGRLTLKGGVREVLATELLEALGVNTSKSFALFETGEPLQRNDEPSPSRSAVLTRLSGCPGRILSRRRLCPWRPQQRQHQHHWRKLRLRPVALHALLGRGFRRGLFRPCRALCLRGPARGDPLEPRPARGLPFADRRS